MISKPANRKRTALWVFAKGEVVRAIVGDGYGRTHKWDFKIGGTGRVAAVVETNAYLILGGVAHFAGFERAVTGAIGLFEIQPFFAASRVIPGGKRKLFGGSALALGTQVNPATLVRPGAVADIHGTVKDHVFSRVVLDDRLVSPSSGTLMLQQPDAFLIDAFSLADFKDVARAHTRTVP